LSASPMAQIYFAFDNIDVYDISRAVEDGATVPIYYESRLARIELNEEENPKIDAEVDDG